MKGVEFRRDDKGELDEVVVHENAEPKMVHFEMMDDDQLWGAIYLGEKQETRVVLWITASKDGKLSYTAEIE